VAEGMLGFLMLGGGEEKLDAESMLLSDEEHETVRELSGVEDAERLRRQLKQRVGWAGRRGLIVLIIGQGPTVGQTSTLMSRPWPQQKRRT